MKMQIGVWSMGAIFAVAATSALATGDHDMDMMKLASKSGCVVCHTVAPAKSADAKPIGPAWLDVAEKYKGDSSASARLTEVVLHGSSPYESHWKGKVSGLSMPPNAVAIKPEEASMLVKWILQLH